jgi:hypothetical protein
MAQVFLKQDLSWKGNKTYFLSKDFKEEYLEGLGVSAAVWENGVQQILERDSSSQTNPGQQQEGRQVLEQTRKCKMIFNGIWIWLARKDTLLFLVHLWLLVNFKMMWSKNSCDLHVCVSFIQWLSFFLFKIKSFSMSCLFYAVRNWFL